MRQLLPLLGEGPDYQRAGKLRGKPSTGDRIGVASLSFGLCPFRNHMKIDRFRVWASDQREIGTAIHSINIPREDSPIGKRRDAT
jgi:hypothetical protein